MNKILSAYLVSKKAVLAELLAPKPPTPPPPPPAPAGEVVQFEANIMSVNPSNSHQTVRVMLEVILMGDEAGALIRRITSLQKASARAFPPVHCAL